MVAGNQGFAALGSHGARQTHGRESRLTGLPAIPMYAICAPVSRYLRTRMTPAHGLYPAYSHRTLMTGERSTIQVGCSHRQTVSAADRLFPVCGTKCGTVDMTFYLVFKIRYLVALNDPSRSATDTQHFSLIISSLQDEAETGPLRGLIRQATRSPRAFSAHFAAHWPAGLCADRHRYGSLIHGN